MRPPPSICVWELTLACNAACVHCGSSAGRARPDELTTDEALALCDALVDLGVGHITLSGGEPVLRRDWARIAQRLVSRGVPVDIISNGLVWTNELARAARDAGVQVVSLSIDGPEVIHDRLRGIDGAWRRAMQAASTLRAAGLMVGAVTQVCTWNAHALADTERDLVAAGFGGWQVQLTMSLGRCEGHALPLPPERVPAVARFVLEAAARGALPVYAGDNIGWMTREEPRLRSARRPCDRVFLGCQAGLSVVGITSNGTVRGCLSMPPALDQGSLRERTLLELWNDPGAFPYNRAFDPCCLTGPCATCAYRRVCRAGCKALAFSATGTLTSNPHCLRGLRHHEETGE